MGRGRAAAAADDVDQPALCPILDLARGYSRGLVIGTKVIWKAGIWIGHHQRIGDAGQRLQMRAQQIRAEGTVQPDRERAGMPDRPPKGVDGMAGQVASRHVGNGHGDHHRQFDAAPLPLLDRRHDRRLGIQRVENRLDQDEVNTAVDQRRHLLGIDGLHPVKIHFAKARIIDVRRQGQRLVGRPKRPGNEARTAILRLRRIGCRAGNPRCGDIQVANQMFRRIVALTDRRRRKCVR